MSPYAFSGTDVAYASYAISGTGLRAPYAISSTDAAYACPSGPLRPSSSHGSLTCSPSSALCSAAKHVPPSLRAHSHALLLRAALNSSDESGKARREGARAKGGAELAGWEEEEEARGEREGAAAAAGAAAGAGGQHQTGRSLRLPSTRLCHVRY